jgi:RimJ/RimL family protein N-acetyltransferase
MMRSLDTPRGRIVLREAKPADAVAFRELRLGALQDSPLAFSQDYQRALSHPPKYWEDTLSPHSDEATIFLAENEQTLIGMTGIVRGGSPKLRHAATVWGVYLRLEWRGLHIAGELIKACLDWAKVRKIVIAKLGVAAQNSSAVRCYQRCGFEVYGTEPRALYLDGRYYDFYLMAMDLDTPPSAES